MSRPWERQPWAEPYHAAILESDENRLFSQIEVARKAIDLRIAELWCTRQKDTVEMDALQNALNVLRLLEKHEPLRKGAA